MKEHVLYVCDCCGTQYSLKTYARACEKNHKAAASIKSAHYLSKSIARGIRTRSPLYLPMEVKDCINDKEAEHD